MYKKRSTRNNRLVIRGVSLGFLALCLVTATSWAGAQNPGRTGGDPQAGQDPPVQEPPPSRIQLPPIGQIRRANPLQGLDLQLSNLNWDEITVQVIGEMVFLQGPEEDLRILQAAIAALDAVTRDKEIRMITMSTRSANDIASTIQDALRDRYLNRNVPEEDLVTITAISSTILLVAALPEEMDFVVALIERVDAVPSIFGQIETMKFEVKNRKASDVATELDEILQQLMVTSGRTGADAAIQIIPNNADNTIMVIAPESDRDTIEAFIANLDVEPAVGWGQLKLTMFPLLHSEAEELATTITDLLTSQQGQDEDADVFKLQMTTIDPTTGERVELPPIDLGKPIRIIPDSNTNSLVVATSEDNIGPVGELIRLMDGVPLAVDLTVRLFPLKYADAATVRDLLQDMFDSGQDLTDEADDQSFGGVPDGVVGEALVYKVSVHADERSNTVIVSGRQPQMLLAQTVIEELDVPSTALKFPLRLIPVSHSDASRIGQVISDLLEQRIALLEATGKTGMALESERVFLAVDVDSNSLIVSASQENYEEIVRIVGQLDSEPAKAFDTIRTITLERMSAADLKEKIDELWARKSSLRQGQDLPEDTPILVADDRANALLVASSLEDFEEMKRLITALEAQPMADHTQLFQLQNADATRLTGMLDELFDGMAADNDSFNAPTIIPDARTNTLIVAASKDVMERVEDLVPRLDVKAGERTASFQAYPLLHASATKLAQKMQTLFDAQAEGRDDTATPIVIMEDEASNSLLVSASRDDHAAIVELLGLLDRASTLARQVEIFPLKGARATQVSQKLEDLFASQEEGGDGIAAAIAIEPDERTNSIIVWGSRSQIADIRSVVSKLDNADVLVEREVRLFPLKQALAADFADMLTQTLVGDSAGTDTEEAKIISFRQTLDDGTVVIRKLLRQDITVVPNERSNLLMVMAPPESMEMLESFIKVFDSNRPITSEIRMYPLINSDAEAMVDQLNELFGEDAGDGGTQSRLMLSGEDLDDFALPSVGQELRFTADPRTNTLIVAGAEIDLAMIEQYVQYLDAQAVEDRIVKVYETRFREAEELANTLRDFNDQELSILESLDETAAQRLLDEQISVASLGTADEGSSSLILGASNQNFDRNLEMLRQLDRPEPQVRLSVLIAEVTLTDTLELGVEIAGQQLNFSDSAFLGPNGVLQGPSFDVIGGTDLGAIGSLLGFNFTVTGEDFSFLLHALQQDSRLEVLSRPTLLIRNGEEGNITIGDEIPFVTDTGVTDSGQTRSTIGRENTGIVLTATPHISPDGYVTVELFQEVSNISGENFQITEGVFQPIISTRELTTNVTLRDGETAVVGGLITERESHGETKVPLLGDIPFLGAFFTAQATTRQKTELLVLLTVDIIETDEDRFNMSIAERDIGNLTDRIKQSPLMEGLRIKPDPSLMGPVDQAQQKEDAAARGEAKKETPPQFGPKPKIYGPFIPRRRTTTTTTTSVEKPVYGPKVKVVVGKSGEGR